jgi:competence protein ComER
VNVGFIGMGNMGQMLVTALASTNIFEPGELMASTRDSDKLRRLAGALPNLRVAYSNRELAQRCQTIFLCLKPGETKAVLAEIAPYLSPDRLLVLITNTIDIPKLESTVQCRVAKVIPSMVQSIQRGVSLVMCGERCTAHDKAFLLRLMGAISDPIYIAESQARVASDLTSCGPAFISYIFRAMVHAARQYQPDLPIDTLNQMVRTTASATFELLARTGLTFDDVITRVSTPGGITADGIKVLDEQLAGVWEQVIETTLIKEEVKKAKVDL